MEGHAESGRRDLDLAYYTAWHAGLFSQPYASGKFPEYERHAPRRKAEASRPQTPEEMKAMARMLTLAFGGTIVKA